MNPKTNSCKISALYVCQFFPKTLGRLRFLYEKAFLLVLKYYAFHIIILFSLVFERSKSRSYSTTYVLSETLIFFPQVNIKFLLNVSPKSFVEEGSFAKAVKFCTAGNDSRSLTFSAFESIKIAFLFVENRRMTRAGLELIEYVQGATSF